MVSRINWSRETWLHATRIARSDGAAAASMATWVSPSTIRSWLARVQTDDPDIAAAEVAAGAALADAPYGVPELARSLAGAQRALKTWPSTGATDYRRSDLPSLSGSSPTRRWQQERGGPVCLPKPRRMPGPQKLAADLERWIEQPATSSECAGGRVL